MVLPPRTCHRCTDDKKIRWGCVTPTKVEQLPIRLANDGVDANGVELPLFRCPMRPRLEDPVGLNRVFEGYNWMQKGFLPDPGGWLDQTAKFTDACAVVSSATDAADKFLNDLKSRRK